MFRAKSFKNKVPHDGLADWTPTGGAMTAIMVDQESGVLSGGADPRRDSYAIGR